MNLVLAALLALAPTPPRVYAHLVPWHPPSHSRPDRALDLEGGVEGMVRAAKAAGVDGFTVDLVLGDPAACRRLMQGYLAAAERVGGFTVGPCLDCAASGDPAFWTQVLCDWAETARGHDGAMRCDDRLVAITYNAPRLSAAAWQQVQAGCAKAGFDPFIVADVEGPLRSGEKGDATIRALAGVLDAFYAFAPFPAGQQRLATLLAGSGREHPLIYAPSPGYWRPSTGALNRTFGGTATYQQTWQETFACHADWAVITTWNDYGESTHIEPSRNNSDLLARLTALAAARLRARPLTAEVTGPETFWLTAPPELPDGPGRGPLEANPRREMVFELTRIGPPSPGRSARFRLLAPDGRVVDERPLVLDGAGGVSASRFTWEPDRTLGVPFLRAEVSVAGVQASLPLQVWPRNVAHRFVLAPLRAKLAAAPPAPPAVRLVGGRLSVEPIAPAAPDRVDLLHNLEHRPDPRSSSGAVAVGAAQLPNGPPEWGFWSAARVAPGGLVSWSDPLWLAPQGELVLLAYYRFDQRGHDDSPYGRTAAIHAEAGAAWQATLADGRHALHSGERVWAEPPGSFLPCRGPLTVSLWCRPAAPGGMLFGDVSAPLLLSLDGLKPRATRHTDKGWVSVLAPEPIPAGRWSQVAGVYDGQDLVLYVDGREVARAKAGPADGSQRMGLGRNPYDGSSRFNGLLTDVVMRGEALAAAQLGQGRPAEPVAP